MPAQAAGQAHFLSHPHPTQLESHGYVLPLAKRK